MTDNAEQFSAGQGVVGAIAEVVCTLQSFGSSLSTGKKRQGLGGFGWITGKRKAS